MQFLRSEGRIVCLMDKQDALGIPPAKMPQVDLLLIPEHHRSDIENSHVWNAVLPSVRLGLRNVVYF